MATEARFLSKHQHKTVRLSPKSLQKLTPPYSTIGATIVAFEFVATRLTIDRT
jgi:hypothetical protein